VIGLHRELNTTETTSTHILSKRIWFRRRLSCINIYRNCI